MLKRQWIGSALIIALCVLISGCGFHLRGEPILPQHLQRLYLSTPEPYGNFARALKQTLHHSGACLVDCPGHAPVSLFVTNTKMYYDTPTIGNSSIARVYRYTFSADYQLRSSSGDNIGPIHHVIASRFTTLNSGILTETNNQIYLLQLGLFEDVSRQIVRRMSAKCWQ